MSRVLGVQRGGVVPPNADKETIADVVRTLIGYGKVDLSQDRLAEILLAMLNYIESSTGTPITPSPTTLNVTYSGNVLTVTVNGVVATANINPVLGGTEYQYDAGGGTFVRATGLGITAVKNSGILTVTIPNNVVLKSFRVHGNSGDLDVQNNFSIILNNLAGTTSYVDVFLPVITLYDCILNLAPSSDIPWIYNISNSPQYQVTNVGNKTISLRFLNMNAYLNWGIKLNF